MRIKASFTLFLMLFSLLIFNQQIAAQQVLNEHETQWILEAQTNLQRAYADPALSENERLKLIRESAVKLKEYGQEPIPPPDELPIRQLMENNYLKKQEEVKQASNFVMEMNKGLLKNKMKFINNLQIDVTGEQIKFLIPGVTTVDLSSDVVSTLFQWNLAEGATGGQRATAKSIKEKFLEIYEAKGEIAIEENQRQFKLESLKKLDEDRKELDTLEKKIRKAYKDAEGSTRTRSGYQNAKLYDGHTYSIDPRLVGTWTFTAPGYLVTHQYSNTGQCQIRINAKENFFKFSTSNGFISYTSSKGKVSKLGYTIEGNLLYYGTKNSRKKAGHPLTKRF